MVFNPALDGWGNWCRQPYTICTSLPHFTLGRLGGMFRVFLGKVKNFPLVRSPASCEPWPCFTSLFQATQFAVKFEPELVWGSIASPNLRRTVECTYAVLFPKVPRWMTRISAPIVPRSAVVMAPIESPRFLHFNVDFVSHLSFVDWANFSVRQEYWCEHIRLIGLITVMLNADEVKRLHCYLNLYNLFRNNLTITILYVTGRFLRTQNV